MSLINIKNLHKSFGKKEVLQGVSLDVEQGETIAIIGPSGCGKSTLLRILLGLDSADSGSIFIEGEDICTISASAFQKIREKIGMVFQSSALFDSLSVAENVVFGLRETRKHLSEKELDRVASEKLSLVGLQGTEKLMPGELSGGMQKRVSLARAIAYNPKIILYDEPTTGLDPLTSVTIENLINKLSNELKVTSIVVTHQLSTIFRTASRIIMLDNGNFVVVGTKDDALKSSNPVIREFIEAGLIK
ncbi:MAG: ABC transporter ATP-binding protein [Candidatus Saganbacteria bacterium]|nr:ABC transporter ATP-binding protein [Candidatus Saganbacteria bacterium]